MQCRKALEEAEGNMEKAMLLLKQKGSDIASKKSDRVLGAGAVASYIHANGSIGAMVLLQSETDFVSKNKEFTDLARDIAMHVSATNPQSIDTLLEEPFIKNPEMTIGALVENAIQKFGEKVVVGNFSRFSSN